MLGCLSLLAKGINGSWQECSKSVFLRVIENLSSLYHPTFVELVPWVETNGNLEFLRPKRRKEVSNEIDIFLLGNQINICFDDFNKLVFVFFVS